MKISKSLFLAFAGLGLFACSNEDVNEGIVNGDANVAVGINLSALRGDITRSVDPSTETNATSGSTAPVTLNSVTLTLESLTGGKSEYNFTTEELQGNSSELTHTFSGVRNPNKIYVSINEGSAEELHLKDVYNVGLAAPLYAETTNFGEATEQNGVLTYNVTLAPRHEIALLEFKGIQHESHAADEKCLFKTLTFEGMFLNSVILHEVTAGEGNYHSFAEAMADVNAPTWSTIGNSFLKGTDGKLPIFPSEEGKCYAYNIFPEIGNDNLPKLTLCFKDVTLSEGQTIAGWTSGNPVYASVSKYRLTALLEDGKVSEENQKKYAVDADGYLYAFQPGYVYRFSNLIVPDEAFGPTPEGGEDAQVIANVEILPWNVVDGTVTWN